MVGQSFVIALFRLLAKMSGFYRRQLTVCDWFIASIGKQWKYAEKAHHLKTVNVVWMEKVKWHVRSGK